MKPATRTRLRHLIQEGSTPDQAAAMILGEIMDLDELREMCWPLLVKAARNEQRAVSTRTLRAALAQGAPPEMRLKLTRTVYRLRDGTEIMWDDMTLDQLDVEIARLRTKIGSMVDRLHALTIARDLMIEKDVAVLGEIPDWVDEVAERLEEMKQAEAPLGATS